MIWDRPEANATSNAMALERAREVGWLALLTSALGSAQPIGSLVRST
jgi:hypothetical protein